MDKDKINKDIKLSRELIAALDEEKGIVDNLIVRNDDLENNSKQLDL